MYTLIYSSDALKQLKKLQKEIQARIIACIERCRIRPQANVKKLVGVPEYSLRVGDYRVIMDIVDDKLIILVIKIGHRKNIYERL